MVDITRLGSSSLRIETPGSTTGRDLPSLPLGTRLQARVVAPAGSGTWQIAVDGREVLAKTALALVAGDVLDVVASRSESGLELRLLQRGARFDETRYAAATLTQAGARPPAPAVLPLADALGALLQAVIGTRPADSFAPAQTGPAAGSTPTSGASGGTAVAVNRPDVVALATALAELTRPLRATSDRQETAIQVRRLIEDSGLLFDARVREALVARAASEPESQALPSTVQRDARTLLGVMSRALGSQRSDATAQGSAQAGAPAEALPALAAAHREVADATLARQLDLAAEWLHAGRLTLGLPLQFADGQQVVAELRVGPDEDAADAPAREGLRGFAFDVRVELPAVGHLEAAVRWAGRDISARVFVDRPELEEATRAELAALATGLRRAGFEHVSTDVRVDPLRHVRTEPSPSLPAGGTIIDACA